MSEPLLSVESARERVLAAIGGPLPAETLSPEAALGQVLATPVVATTDLPPWDNSAMDGYAIRAADVADAAEDRPVRLRVVGEVPAGGVADRAVEPGTAIRIATGAPLPAGADAVVPVELTTPLDEAGDATGPRGRDATGPLPAACAVHEAVGEGNAVRRRGEDVRAGATVLETGMALTPAAVGLAAGVGVGTVTVHRRPRIAVLATGDEVRGAGEPLGPAGIPDANGPGLRAMVTAAGATPVDLGIARDDLDDVLNRLRRGIAEADAVIVSGGVSVGPYDVVKLAFEAVGRVDLWRVAVQPGKPFAYGVAANGVRPVRPAGQSGQQLCDLRAVRPTGHSPAGRPPASPPRDGRRRAGRSGRQGARPARVPAGRRRARQGRPTDPRRDRPIARAAGRRPRQSRPERPRRSPRHWPSSRKMSTACPPAPLSS